MGRVEGMRNLGIWGMEWRLRPLQTLFSLLNTWGWKKSVDLELLLLLWLYTRNAEFFSHALHTWRLSFVLRG